MYVRSTKQYSKVVGLKRVLLCVSYIPLVSLHYIYIILQYCNTGCNIDIDTGVSNKGAKGESALAP